MIIGIFHMILGACTSIFLLKGYHNKTRDVKGMRLGHDRGSFLKLYNIPYQRFTDKYEREDWRLYFRLGYPTTIGFFAWALGFGVQFYLIFLGSMIAELYFHYKGRLV